MGCDDDFSQPTNAELYREKIAAELQSRDNEIKRLRAALALHGIDPDVEEGSEKHNGDEIAYCSEGCGKSVKTDDYTKDGESFIYVCTECQAKVVAQRAALLTEIT